MGLGHNDHLSRSVAALLIWSTLTGFFSQRSDLSTVSIWDMPTLKQQEQEELLQQREETLIVDPT